MSTVSGVMIAPGVSRNNRLYTPDLLRKAFTRLHARISEGRRPVTMLTHHAAADDSTRIVGRLTDVTQETDGTIRFAAVLADTDHARTIETLADKTNRFLSGVSIRGYWIGDVNRVDVDGQPCETADDLEIDGLDFTANPGVPAARLDEQAGRHPVTESVEAFVDTTVEASKKPYGDVTYADPGYQSDGVKRYPLDTKAHVRAAWAYINQARNAKAYTAAQLKQVKKRIKTAAGKFGVTITDEGWAVEPVTETAVAEYGVDVGASYGSLRICATNGPITVDICGYGLDPADLELIGQAAMKAATDALAALDPDMDGDIDLPGGAPGSDDSNESTTTEEQTMAETQAPNQATEANQVAPPTTSTTETTTGTTTTATVDAALVEAVAAAVAAKLAANSDGQPNSSTAEQTAAGTGQQAEESDPASILAGLSESQKAALVAELTKAGQITVTRKGYGFVGENTDEIPTGSDLWERRGDLFAAAFGVQPE